MLAKWKIGNGDSVALALEEIRAGANKELVVAEKRGGGQGGGPFFDDLVEEEGEQELDVVVEQDRGRGSHGVELEQQQKRQGSRAIVKQEEQRSQSVVEQERGSSVSTFHVGKSQLPFAHRKAAQDSSARKFQETDKGPLVEIVVPRGQSYSFVVLSETEVVKKRLEEKGEQVPSTKLLTSQLEDFWGGSLRGTFSTGSKPTGSYPHPTPILQLLKTPSQHPLRVLYCLARRLLPLIENPVQIFLQSQSPGVQDKPIEDTAQYHLTSQIVDFFFDEHVPLLPSFADAKPGSRLSIVFDDLHDLKPGRQQQQQQTSQSKVGQVGGGGDASTEILGTSDEEDDGDEDGNDAPKEKLGLQEALRRTKLLYEPQSAAAVEKLDAVVGSATPTAPVFVVPMCIFVADQLVEAIHQSDSESISETQKATEIVKMKRSLDSSPLSLLQRGDHSVLFTSPASAMGSITYLVDSSSAELAVVHSLSLAILGSALIERLGAATSSSSSSLPSLFDLSSATVTALALDPLVRQSMRAKVNLMGWEIASEGEEVEVMKLSAKWGVVSLNRKMLALLVYYKYRGS